MLWLEQKVAHRGQVWMGYPRTSTYSACPRKEGKRGERRGQHGTTVLQNVVGVIQSQTLSSSAEQAAD